MSNKCFKTFFLLLTFGVASVSLSAQSYIKQFIGDSGGVSSAKIWHLDEDHYYLLRTEAEPDNIGKQNHLEIIEYDYCGVVGTHEVYFDQLWDVELSGEIFEEGDTLRIPVRSNPSPNGPHTELGLISMHKYNFSGRYQFLRAENVIHNISCIPYRDSFYLLLGFISYTSGPVAVGAFLVDRNFKLIDYYQYYGAKWAIGSIQIVGNDIYLFSGNQITKLNTSLEPIWTKMTDWPFYTRKSFRVNNGFVLTITKSNIERQFFLVHLDFNGEVRWLSENLITDPSIYSFPNAFQNESGEIYAIKQKINAFGKPDGMTLSILDERNGALKSQWKLDESFRSLRFNDFLMESNGGSLLALDSINNAYVFKFSTEEISNCLLQDTVDFSEKVAFDFRDTTNFPHVFREFNSGSFSFSAEEKNLVLVENSCQDELPEFDLLPDQFLNCGQKSVSVDLTDIPFAVSWADGTVDRIREFSEPGTYSYTYEVCDDLYGELFVVENNSCPCDWYVPNAFSPNNDGFNDAFKVFNSCAEIVEFNIQVFNRWGGLMFTSEQSDFLWDGIWKGKPCPSGVYTYLLYYRDVLSGEARQREQGTIFLMR